MQKQKKENLIKFQMKTLKPKHEFFIFNEINKSYKIYKLLLNS